MVTRPAPVRAESPRRLLKSTGTPRSYGRGSDRSIDFEAGTEPRARVCGFYR